MGAVRHGHPRHANRGWQRRGHAQHRRPASSRPPEGCGDRLDHAVPRPQGRDAGQGMKTRVDDVDLYFDVAGAKRVPDGPTMVERPTILLLHGGPGFDASIWANTMQTLSEWASDRV